MQAPWWNSITNHWNNVDIKYTVGKCSFLFAYLFNCDNFMISSQAAIQLFSRLSRRKELNPWTTVEAAGWTEKRTCYKTNSIKICQVQILKKEKFNRARITETVITEASSVKNPRSNINLSKNKCSQNVHTVLYTLQLTKWVSTCTCIAGNSPFNTFPRRKILFENIFFNKRHVCLHEGFDTRNCI